MLLGAGFALPAHALTTRDCQTLKFCESGRCAPRERCRECEYKRTCDRAGCAWRDVCRWGAYRPVAPNPPPLIPPARR
jgi:hypothetical protein